MEVTSNATRNTFIYWYIKKSLFTVEGYLNLLVLISLCMFTKETGTSAQFCIMGTGLYVLRAFRRGRLCLIWASGGGTFFQHILAEAQIVVAVF